MDKITINAFAKINLGLDVIKKREDGYHEVKMIMQNVGLYDIIEMKRNNTGEVKLSTNVDSIPTDGRNLICKAIELLRKKYDIIDGVDVYLEKNIPVEAGMAGGSTDCAAAIKGMNEIFELGMSLDEMMVIGKSLGADVPYCILAKPALAEGIGERLTPIDMPLKCYVVIAKPVIGVSTAFVYGNLKANELKEHPDIDGMLIDIKNNDLYGMCSKMGNVLETVTVKAYPVIEEIKNVMIEEGAVNSLMSGSGPTVFGIFDDEKKAAEAADFLSNRSDIAYAYKTNFVV